MARKQFICDPQKPYHVTSRCINMDWFAQPLDQVWDIFSSNLMFIQSAFKLEVISFVLMSNHFHLLVRSPQANLSQAMQYFLNQSSRQLLHDSQRINSVFVQRFGRCRLDTLNYFFNTYKYIYQNPLRANLVDRVENYKYSTLPGKLGLDRSVIPYIDQTLFENVEKTVEWLNERPPEEHNTWMRKALRRSVFKYPRTVQRKENPLNQALL